MTSERRSSEDRIAAPERRLRLAFLEGAEKQSQATQGRRLTDDELRRVIGRFPVTEGRR